MLREVSEMVDKLRELCMINGASGDERRVRGFIEQNIRADEVFTDKLGNLIVFKKGKIHFFQ